MYCLQKKMTNFKQELKSWNKNHFGDIFQDQYQLENQMKQIQLQIIQQGRT